MSNINDVIDEMLPSIGSISVDQKAQSVVRFLRSMDLSLVDCLHIAGQMHTVITKDNEWVLPEHHQQQEKDSE
jgi:hypothetical protein